MTTAPGTPASIDHLMNMLLREPGRPRITWYGDDGERVELSGAVLVNWISKTTNLLVEEFDAAPGCRTLIDLPVHWRTAVWAMGAWRAGATVVLPGADGSAPDGRAPDVVVTTRPGQFTGDVVAVALPALARRFDGDLPPGAVDAAGAVMTYADQVLWTSPTDPSEPALIAPAASAPVQGVLHADLLAWAGRSASDRGSGTPLHERARVLLDGRAPVADVLAATVGIWVAGGSVVLTSPATAAGLEADGARRERLVAQEGVTVVG